MERVWRVYHVFAAKFVDVNAGGSRIQRRRYQLKDKYVPHFCMSWIPEATSKVGYDYSLRSLDSHIFCLKTKGLHFGRRLDKRHCTTVFVIHGKYHEVETLMHTITDRGDEILTAVQECHMKHAMVSTEAPGLMG